MTSTRAILDLMRLNFLSVGKQCPDALGVDSHDLSDPADEHLALYQGQCKGLKEQRKAAAGARPGTPLRCVLGLACAGGDTRHVAMQEAVVLKEVQVLPSALRRVMH